MNKPILWQIGDSVPFFTAAETNNPTFHYSSVGGVYSVLSFLGTTKNPATRAALDHIASRAEQFDDYRLCFFGILIDREDHQQKNVPMPRPSFRYFWDMDHAVSKLYGAVIQAPPQTEGGTPVLGYRPFTLVVDPMLRVLAVIPMLDVEAHNRAFDTVLASLAPKADDHAGVPLTAPVLVVPRVFDRELCKRLIGYYEEKGGKESGFMREINGVTTPVMDHGFKRRRDVHIEDQDFQELVRTRIRRLLAPQIVKAFQFKPTRMERYLVACYDSQEQGFFRAHRDNTTKGTAHRKFACTINLNAEDYEGGDLVFPEFGRKTYRAPTGGAVIFSCSLLHEATPVTNGTRYAFLPFFYDEEGAKVRDENRGFLTDSVLDLNQQKTL